MNAILVTGAAGFIGSNFVRHWRRAHPADRVIAYDLLTYSGCRANLADVAGIDFVEGDIRDRRTVERTLRRCGVDVVVNFAAESHNSRAVLEPAAFFETNVMGPVALLEAVRAVSSGGIRFHQISTCEVYGDMALDAPGAFTEQSPYLPRTPYNAAKAGGDHATRAFGYTYGIPFTVTTCANNYGPYQFPEKVIPLFVTQALQGRPLPVYASSRNRREWLHVEDHCRAVEAVLLHGRTGETYNIGSGVEVDVETLADSVLAELGLGPELKARVPDRPSHDRRYLLDSGKVRTELGWAPRIGFAAGLRETISWYRENESWWRPLLARASTVQESAWGDARP
ncbi:dTDP-glucose 4,6-dehydratase [Micromonospora siamensis]|uniref:dTDP-glucose 4,6-dehydratase n=1 Tax=Micromonospora siamensis TaxID=299152 RepID=A0A1C5I915_9ACTN|nr:dTDP-glucose 4,6-dehydratase [Micromonospora siamensis]SCG54858.1 dTDP-glucose 4,6-dehydratase [Micromonospora siamensis]